MRGRSKDRESFERLEEQQNTTINNLETQVKELSQKLENLQSGIKQDEQKIKGLTPSKEGLKNILAPMGSTQELWACGVTYLRSKIGRQEESKDAGGGDFYAKVYEAARPEVFFKATPHRVVGH